MELSKYAHRLVGQPMFKIAERIESSMDMNGLMHNFSRFDIGDPDFQTPRAVKDATINAINQGMTHYTSSSGTDLLKQSISMFTHIHGAGFSPDLNQIVVAPGCNPLIYCILRVLVDEGDSIAVCDPGFPTYRSVASLMNLKVHSLPLREDNGFNVDPKDIFALPKEVKVVMVNSPNNPTGAMMSKEDAMNIFNACNNSGRYLISDEIYHLMTYGKEHFSPCAIDKCKTNTIMINGFSKSFAMSGYRLGYMIGPTDVCEKVALLLQTIVSCTSHFVQLAGCEAYDRVPSDLSRMLSVLRDRRRVLVKCLNEIGGITCGEPDGAFYVFPNITGTGLTSREFTDLMFKNQVAVVCGTDFGEYGEGYIRMALTESTVNARIGLNRIENTLTGKSDIFSKTKKGEQ